MKTFFAEYIDLVVLVMCFVLTFVNTWRVVRRATVPIRKLPAYWLVFGATSVATFIGVGHLFEISYHAAGRMLAGTFVYDFRFYSLMLMGMVLLFLSVYMLRYIARLLEGVPGSQAGIFRMMAYITLICLPAAFLTSIAMAPVIACGISLLALPFVVRRPASIQATTAQPLKTSMNA